MTSAASPRLAALLAARRVYRTGEDLEVLQERVDALGLGIDLAQEMWPDLRRDLDAPPAW